MLKECLPRSFPGHEQRERRSINRIDYKVQTAYEIKIRFAGTGKIVFSESKRRADLKEQRLNLATVRPDIRTVIADLSQRRF